MAALEKNTDDWVLSSLDKDVLNSDSTLPSCEFSLTINIMALFTSNLKYGKLAMLSSFSKVM